MEKSLWEQGCLSWATLLSRISDFKLGQADRKIVRSVIEQSINALATGDHRYFSKQLGLKNAWRAYPDFRSKSVYLDIETDGGNTGSSVTTIGVFDGVEFRCFIKGKNLDEFPAYMDQFSMVITFYGSGFDLPMLQKCYKDLRFSQIHLDLCPTLREVGIRGGLKKIEKQLGLSRGEDTDGLTGLDAIRLWNRYRTLRDEKALETLIAYNREDVVNLEVLAGIGYKMLKEATLGDLVPTTNF